MSTRLIPVNTQQKLSLFPACFLAFVSRGSSVGESKIFCLFEGGDRVAGTGLKLDNVDLCDVDDFGVEGCDCNPREDPPNTEHSY